MTITQSTKMKNFLFLLTVFLSSFSVLNAQERIDSEQLKVHTINGEEYYIHLVEKGNTLYSISRLYTVPIDAIKKENPRLTTSLTIGDRLLIPVDEVKRKNLEESVDIDGNYIIYEVQRNNTLYSIAKEYKLEVNDIIAANPKVKDGLKRKMKLRIPVAKIKADTNQTEYIVPAAASPYVTHRVEKKETLYALSKQYEVSIDSIKAVNNGLPGGLKEGQLINLPIIKNYKDSSDTTVSFDSTGIQPQYRLAVLLPFYLDLMESAKDTTYRQAEKINEALFNKAKYGIEFYRGFKIAADSMVKNGMNVKLNIFDTANDTAKVAEVLKDTALKKSDLIIGPLYFDEFMKTADYAKKQKVPIVSPVKQSNKILLGNAYVSKVASSNPVLLKFLAKYMADSLRNENIVLVYPDHLEERKNADLLKKTYLEKLNQIKDTNRWQLPKEIYWNPKRFVEIKAALDSVKENIIVAPSEEKPFVTQLLNMLSRLNGYKIRVIGLDKWANFDNIDVDHLQLLNVHLVMSDFINYQSEAVLDFERKFYNKYGQVPERFSYLGYDVAWYYLNLLKQYGVNVSYAYGKFKCSTLAHKFDFFKTGFESGYENHSVYLVRYRDFEMQQVY